MIKHAEACQSDQLIEHVETPWWITSALTG